MTLPAEVSFTVILGSEHLPIEVLPGAYRSLMELIRDKLYPEEFGECKGVGRCGTCVVKIEEGGERLLASDRNEPVTLERSGIKEPLARLSCQIPINDRLEGTTIILQLE